MITADFKCHTSASETGPVHCVFHHDGTGSWPSWFSPASEVAAGCAKVNATSILAKLGHLPSMNGQFHFRGTVKVCVVEASLEGKRDKLKGLIVPEFLKALGAAGSEDRVSDRSARKGNNRVSFDDLPDAATQAAYCIGKD